MHADISGIHHITALAGHPQRNLEFYTRVIGLRLVKLTVNFDDPGTYHFYFGDRLGAPGSILTFFPWPRAAQGKRGPGQATAVAFSVPAGSLDYWRERLGAAGAAVRAPDRRLGERVLAFEDPDGLDLEFVISSTGDERSPWPQGPVPEASAVRGLAGATLCLHDPAPTIRLLSDTLGFRPDGEEGVRHRLVVGDGGPGARLDIVGAGESKPGRIAAGSVHHIALSLPDDEAQQEWRERLISSGLHVTQVKDRRYFRSIYFREPGGVLLELATEGPGFTLDEPEEALGQRLQLPDWLEARRAEIEGQLEPLEFPEERVMPR